MFFNKEHEFDIKTSFFYLIKRNEAKKSQYKINLDVFSILKKGKAKAIRFSTMEAICEILDCQSGDILEFVQD
jgi:putative transcriptional regulator